MRWIVFSIIGLLMIPTCLLIFAKQEIKKKKQILTYENRIQIINTTVNDSFSVKGMYEYLKQINVKFPDIVMSQAINETGFSTIVFRGNHNPFNMKLANTRPSTSIGFDNGHAVYSNWKDACLDYALYQAAFYRGVDTKGEYFQCLGKANFQCLGKANYMADSADVFLGKIKETASRIDYWIDFYDKKIKK